MTVQYSRLSSLGAHRFATLSNKFNYITRTPTRLIVAVAALASFLGFFVGLQVAPRNDTWASVMEANLTSAKTYPRTKMVFILPYADYLTRMNTYKYEIVDAAIKHPSIDAEVWGPSWDDYSWDNSLSMSQNMKKRYNCKVDIMVTFQKLDDMEFWDLKYDGPGCDTVWIHEIGDCHYDTCIKEWFPYHGNITVSKYAFELIEMFDYPRLRDLYPGFPMQLFAHSPDVANEWQFYPKKWSRRRAEAMLFGSVWDFYPIRLTVNTAIEEGETFIQIHDHPGYIIEGTADAWNHPGTYDPTSRLHEKHRENLAHFAEQMRNTKVCVFDGSLERKMIRKYAQAMLSGCVVAGDIPDDMPYELRDAVISLDQSWDIETINAVIRNEIRNDAEMQRKAIKALKYARTHFTSTRKLEGMMELAADYRNGHRGYVFPTSVRSTCRRYMSEGGWTQEWCR